MLDLLKATEKQNEAVYEAAGVHLLLTLRECSSEILNDEIALRLLCSRAVEATQATILQVCSHHFSPQGVTVTLILAESHASLHTYPESNTIFWDCFTCGPTCQPEQSAAILIEALRPAAVDKQIILRS
jgi:S-adenosylmethionine decarboxylase